MPKIDWQVFKTGFNKLNRNHLSVAQVSKNGHITPSYLYRVCSKNNHPETVTYKMAYRIGRGFGLSPQKSQNWTKRLLRHTRNPNLRRTARHVKESSQRLNDRFAHQSKYKTSKSKSISLERESTPELIERAEKRHPVVKFCPVEHKSDLALHVKQLMGDKQISMKNLCKKTYLNKQRLHDLFNGKTKTVSRLTAVRLADGLDIPVGSLFIYNHYTPKIKTIVMSDDNESDDVPKEPLTKLISRLNDYDTKLIKDMVYRLLIAERHEGKHN